MPIPTPDHVLALLDTRPGFVFNDKELARHFQMHTRQDLYNFADVLEGMIAANSILYLEHGKAGVGFTSIKSAVTAEGVLDYVSQRKAFAIVEDVSPDIVLHLDSLKGALHGDTIMVRYLPTFAEDERPEGVVVQVLKRNRTKFVGTVRASGRRLLLEPEMKRIWESIAIDLDNSLPAKPGDKIVVEITQWGGDGQTLQGKIIEHLGVAGTHKAEMLGILSEFGLPEAFPDAVNEAANAITAGITQQEVARRRDMRTVSTFTIDPADAKDFDDALSIQRLENGDWEVGVHIADVTHYVQEGTLLEMEALQRGTSVYLVDRVVPMLPEHLSNGLCSLRPHEDKLTFSAVFVLDATTAQVKGSWFGRTVIHSDHRFSYEDAQEILEGNDGPFKDDILTLNKLAHLLREERFRHGSVSFETPELRFLLDADGKPLKVVQKVRKEAHMLIEDFMLLANKHVAQFVFNLKQPATKGKGALAGKPVNPMVYRVHEPPDPDKITMLSRFVGRFGYKFDLDAGNLPAALNKLASQTLQKPEAVVIAQYAVRSMMKARYTLEPMGHFGLGFDHYSHFTSPIRRYPDMMTHRCLAQYLAGQWPSDTDLLAKACKHATDMEKRASDAERASIKYKQVEFMMSRIGESFSGLVSGLTEWGVYVELEENACEGMVRLADLRDDHYIYDPEKMMIYGRAHGRTFQFGDRLQIRVKDANLLRRTLDFELPDASGGKRGSSAGRDSNPRRAGKPGGGYSKGGKGTTGGRGRR